MYLELRSLEKGLKNKGLFKKKRKYLNRFFFLMTLICVKIQFCQRRRTLSFPPEPTRRPSGDQSTA